MITLIFGFLVIIRWQIVCWLLFPQKCLQTVKWLFHELIHHGLESSQMPRFMISLKHFNCSYHGICLRKSYPCSHLKICIFTVFTTKFHLHMNCLFFKILDCHCPTNLMDSLCTCSLQLMCIVYRSKTNDNSGIG